MEVCKFGNAYLLTRREPFLKKLSFIRKYEVVRKNVSYQDNFLRRVGLFSREGASAVAWRAPSNDT